MPVVRACVTTHFGEVTAEDVGASRDGVVGFVDCVAAENDSVAADACLRVDYGVAADDGGAALYAPADVEVAEEDEGASGEVAFDLHGAEDTGGVVDLLAGGNENVLTDIGAVAGRLGEGCRREQKHESEDARCLGQQGSPMTKSVPVCGTEGESCWFRSFGD